MPRNKGNRGGQSIECYHCGAEDQHHPDRCPEYLRILKESKMVTAKSRDKKSTAALEKALNKPGPVNPYQTVPPVKYIAEVEHDANWKSRPRISSLNKALDVLEDIVAKFPWPKELHFN
eukprot:PhF_6_TR31762/c0_g1_i1/m.46762